VDKQVSTMHVASAATRVVAERALDLPVNTRSPSVG
jgi:hypothetical protein